MSDFAHVWQAADKIVYSTTLHEASTAKTHLERDFDPDAVCGLKASAAGDLIVEVKTMDIELSVPGHLYRRGEERTVATPKAQVLL